MKIVRVGAGEGMEEKYGEWLIILLVDVRSVNKLVKGGKFYDEN